MQPTKVILLACGSFNPPTNMHLRMFEIAKDHLHRMGQHVVIGGLLSPVHDAYGKNELESSEHRINMIKLALQNNDWIKLSEWECKQEGWSRTKQVLQYHQNYLNSFLQSNKNNHYDLINEDEIPNWVPENIGNCFSEPIKVKLLCGADLLESFGTPGLWSEEDINSIVGQHGLIVITRSNTNPLEFIYNSDQLTKFMANITIVTDWVKNEVSSTKIRRALRRQESVRYLIPDKILDYILKNGLYGSSQTKYLLTPNQTPAFSTPSPLDISMESPSPTNCMMICNNNLFASRVVATEKRMSIDTVDSVSKSNILNAIKHPGQAVKIITDADGQHQQLKIIKTDDKLKKKEVRSIKESSTSSRQLKSSKSFTHFDAIEGGPDLKHSRSNTNLKECKSCDENLIKFIFTKHGIQVISDVETIV